MEVDRDIPWAGNPLAASREHCLTTSRSPICHSSTATHEQTHTHTLTQAFREGSDVAEWSLAPVTTSGLQGQIAQEAFNHRCQLESPRPNYTHTDSVLGGGQVTQAAAVSGWPQKNP